MIKDRGKCTHHFSGTLTPKIATFWVMLCSNTSPYTTGKKACGTSSGNSLFLAVLKQRWSVHRTSLKGWHKLCCTYRHLCCTYPHPAGTDQQQGGPGGQIGQSPTFCRGPTTLSVFWKYYSTVTKAFYVQTLLSRLQAKYRWDSYK